MSHTQVQWARGTSAQVAAYTGPAGEIVVDTDDYSLSVQDGATAGGYARLTPGILPPQGRLTLTGGASVLTTDTINAATIYYTPHIGRWCPIWNGSVWLQLPFPETGLALDSNSGDSLYQATGNLYDIFAFLDAGVFTLGTGPAWASLTSRGSGSGTTQIAKTIGSVNHGLWTNAVAITLRFGNAAGNTVGVPANQATYLGTLYATANGQTGMQFKPAAASGGSNAILGLYNAYNRVRHSTRACDSASSWTYSTGSYRNANNSAGNRVNYVDGLGQSFANARYLQLVEAGSGASPEIGIGFNTSGSAIPVGVVGYTQNGAQVTIAAVEQGIALGFNYFQAQEFGGNGSGGTFFGAAAGLQQLDMQVEM